MLHVLQCLMGTSMAAVADTADLISTQSFVGGPTRRGSSFSSIGGKRWRFLGRIYEPAVSAAFSRKQPSWK